MSMTTKNLSKKPCRSNQKSGRESLAASKRSASKPGSPKAKRPARGESASGRFKNGSKGGRNLAGFTCKPWSEFLKGGLMQIENGPVGGEALADVFDPAELAERVKKAGYIRRWCLQNPEGGAVSGESGRIELTAGQVRDRLEYAGAPLRAGFLKDCKKFDACAKRAYPAMFRRGSREAKVIEGFLLQLPEITRLPNWRLIVGDAILGGSVRLARGQT